MLDAIVPIPAFFDNYIWAFTDQNKQLATVVDPGDAQPVLDFLRNNNLQLSHILITHHHADHTGGVNELLQLFDAHVIGPASSPFDGIKHRVRQDDNIEVYGDSFKVIEVPGHTLDHIAYYSEPESLMPVLFCGDTLFAAGCGRVFEGTAVQMHTSLSKLAALPEATRVYCTHEYTLANLAFAAAVEPSNPTLQIRTAADKKTRDEGLPTLPSTIKLELATNPFLRCCEPAVISALKTHGEVPLARADEAFAALRKWKDGFK